MISMNAVLCSAPSAKDVRKITVQVAGSPLLAGQMLTAWALHPSGEMTKALRLGDIEVPCPEAGACVSFPSPPLEYWIAEAIAKLIVYVFSYTVPIDVAVNAS
jgi:hypothetical protein